MSQQALDLAEDFLSGDHPSALKRLISEGRDGVARSLRARAYDAQES